MSRRHRIHEFEVEPTKRALEIYLSSLLEEREEELEAMLTFRLLFRLHEHRVGKPDYPNPLTWSSMSSWLRTNGSINPKEVDASDILSQVVAHFSPGVRKGGDPPAFTELLAFIKNTWPELESRDRVNVSAQALRELMVPYQAREVRS
jgi:hypothetical protein